MQRSCKGADAARRPVGALPYCGACACSATKLRTLIPWLVVGVAMALGSSADAQSAFAPALSGWPSTQRGARF
jgi:hypothetical protein